MANTINTLTINGKLVSWSNVRLTFGGDLFTGFTSIDFSGEKRERTQLYLATKSHAPIGESDGKYTPPAIKIKGPVHAISQLRDWWASKATDGKSYGDTDPQLGVLQYDLGPGTDELKIEFRYVRWAENGGGAEESPDPNQEEVTLQPRYIVRNGKTLFNSAEEV